MSAARTRPPIPRRTPPLLVSACLAVACLAVACSGGKAASPDHAPTSASATLATAADTPSAPVTPTVSDPDPGDTFTFSIVTQPGRGLAAVTAGQLVYTPDPAFSGADQFTFRATDSGGLSVDGTATVSVTAANHAPTATGGGRVLLAGQSTSRIPWVDDPDLWDTFTVSVLTPPASGTVTTSGNRWTYTPDAAFTSGTDLFTYELTDAGGLSHPGTAALRVYDAAALSACTTASTVNPDGTLATAIHANGCAFYAVAPTRLTAAGAQVTMDYFASRPSTGNPKAIVVLIPGGDFDAGIGGTASTGVAAATGGGNFLVRAAQLLADAGYATIAVDRPSDLPSPGATDTTADADQYRISARHAVDVLQVLKHVNTENRHVFIAGTSKGALSSVALNLVAAGISVSSPVTSGLTYLHVGQPGVPNLLPAYVQRPAHVLWNTSDLCNVSTPAGAQALAASLSLTTPTSPDTVTGGLRVTVAGSNVTPDVCGAFDYHGYLGIEPAAMGRIAAWLDGQVAALAGDARPEAAYVTVPTAAGTPRRVDLATLVRDQDADPLSFALPSGSSVLGGTVTLAGAVVTYTPPGGLRNATDAFSYVVTDGRGGVGAAVVTVQIGN